MAQYPEGVQNAGESPLDRFKEGQIITLKEYSPDGAGCSNTQYQVLEIMGDSAMIVILSPHSEEEAKPIKATLAYLRERLVADD